MSYKTILVHLDTSARSQTRLDLAVTLAEKLDAHLIGLFAPFQPDARSYYIEPTTLPYLAEQDEWRRAQGVKLEAVFRAAIAREGVLGEWRTTEDYPNTVVPLHARHADLVVAGQFDANDPLSYVAAGFCENLVLTSGCPILFVPHAGSFPVLGAHVTVGWDGSRESARAVHDAMPLLKGAARVTVLTVNAPSKNASGQRIPGVDIATSIARHGVSVETLEIDGADPLHIGQALLSQVADLNADLLVTGAYAHARWQELIVGGVTRTLLKSMTIPALMSH
jgi:nucleotide-binding universal stress UspA family protein